MKIFNLDKNGALNLSINAIVVLIIAIVFLGLALTFTRTIINKSSEKLTGGIDGVKLTSPPDADHPIIVEGNDVSVGRGKKSSRVDIGFYNTDTNSVSGVRPVIKECSGVTDNSKLPIIETLTEDVGASSATGFGVFFQEKGLEAKSYICRLVITTAIDGSSITPANNYASIPLTFTVSK